MAGTQRTPKAHFDDIPGELPDASVPENARLHSIAQSAITKLNSLQRDDLAKIAIWRDLLALTDFYRTFYSADSIFAILKKLGMGTVSLMYDTIDQKWRIWMLRTWLECFDGYGHPDVIQPGTSSDNPSAFRTMGDVANGDAGDQTKSIPHYEAIIVGGGQAGLAIGGRLQALNVPYIVLERHREVGHVWGERYESLRWHTSKEYGNLPFGHTYPETDDKLLPAKRIAAGHRNWAERYRINVRTEANVESAVWSEITRTWTVTASKHGNKFTLTAKNLVLAIGPGHGTPVYPPWATKDEVRSSGFKGTVVHSFQGYHSANQWAGRKGIVIGTANTAHDVAEDMANAKMETTMVQRSPTFIFPVEWLIAAEDVHYHADLHPAVADREAFTYPNKILREIVNQAVHKGIAANPARFDALEKAGFKLDRYGDIYNNLYFRFGGHYVDIGCSARIANGEIKIKTEGVKRLTEDGLLFEDGQEIGADLIVLCTGFDHDFRNDAARILGRDMADRIDEYYGMNKEGEIRGHARPAGHPNLYYHGGDVRMARFFSQFVALQIQADVLGSPMQPYLDS